MSVIIQQHEVFDLVDKVRELLAELVSLRSSKGAGNRLDRMELTAHNAMYALDDLKHYIWKNLEEKTAKAGDSLYLIWSEEHQAWWGPNKEGYTRWLAKAGRYSFEEAIKIEADANQHLDIDAGQFHEVIVKDPLPL